MKTKLLFINFLVVIIFSFHHSGHAADNKELLERCRVNIKANFDFTKTSTGKEEWDYMYCQGYFNAIHSQFKSNCSDINRLDVWQNDTEQAKSFREYYSAGVNNTDAIIQSFVLWVPTSPDDWEYSASSTVYKWLPKLYPCNQGFND
ncbi:Rap1a/Tai family immunity protein [Alphaproteobacteria bacterium]|nr:Rap1a/Tai family immunity protein [Alphaproteobacteria bacterium]